MAAYPTLVIEIPVEDEKDYTDIYNTIVENTRLNRFNVADKFSSNEQPISTAFLLPEKMCVGNEEIGNYIEVNYWSGGFNPYYAVSNDELLFIHFAPTNESHPNGHRFSNVSKLFSRLAHKIDEELEEREITYKVTVSKD